MYDKRDVEHVYLVYYTKRPVSKIRLANVDLKLGQRRRRWPNFKPTFTQLGGSYIHIYREREDASKMSNSRLVM